MANPNVALASNNLQIEGVASLKGHPLDEGNVTYIESYRQAYPDAFERHNQINFGTFDLVEIIPRRIALYKHTVLAMYQSLIGTYSTLKEKRHTE